MHYLVTGHTGFKGAWLSIWLTKMGHTVSGISLDPEVGSLFEVCNLEYDFKNDFRIDIRDVNSTQAAIKSISPDVVFHLAAQPLVRESYAHPRKTIETNAIGTLNILEGVSQTPSVKAHVVITTDKVYRNINQVAGYLEQDPMGGDDPYSASKAMADIVTHSWITSFPSPPTAIARAGNVIGGGDCSKDRLLPDLLNSFTENQAPVLRYPEAVRPWQHVLDCLNGYLKIADYLLDGKGHGQAWNIGPDEDSFVTVGTVADFAAEVWGNGAKWQQDQGRKLHEANLLALDATKAKSELGWQNVLDFKEAVRWTVNWQKLILDGARPRGVCEKQIDEFSQIYM